MGLFKSDQEKREREKRLKKNEEAYAKMTTDELLLLALVLHHECQVGVDKDPLFTEIKYRLKGRHGIEI